MTKNTAKDNKVDDGVPREPAEAFDEHLPLDTAKINEIQAEASTNTQANIQQNKDNDPDPVMG